MKFPHCVFPIRLPRSVLLAIMSLFSVKMMNKTYLRRFTGTTLCAVVKFDVTSTTLKRINAKSGKCTSNSKVSSHIGFRAFREDILVLNLQQSRGIPRTWKTKRLLKKKKNLKNAYLVVASNPSFRKWLDGKKFLE